MLATVRPSRLLAIEPGRRQSLLLHGEIPHFDGSNDRLGKWLKILFLYHRLNIHPIRLLSRGIVLLVLVQDDLIPRRALDA